MAVTCITTSSTAVYHLPPTLHHPLVLGKFGSKLIQTRFETNQTD